MTNVESMDYTHAHPSTILASLIPHTFRRYHTPTIYLPQNSHHTYLLCISIAIARYIAMQLSTVPFIMTRPIIVILLFA